MRSGSTFTADLFNQLPQVFYYYEPLWSFDFLSEDGNPSKTNFRDPQLLSAKELKQLSSLQKDTVRGVLSCDFWQINSQVYDTFKQRWAVNKSNSCKPFAKCARCAGTQACLPLLGTACTSARVALTKTVRFSMDQANSLLQDDPKVKVIHLVRDPRGVLRSRQVTNVGLKYHVTPERLCSKVLQDLRVSEKLKKQYPGRILTARYEDLAEQPLNFTQRLLNFAGLQMTPALQQYVWNITSSGQQVAEKKDSTIRSDSRITAFSWRYKSSFNFVARVDKHCLKVYDHMGYVLFANNEERKDQRISAYRKLSQELPWLWSP